jgi:hypothetical protein
MEGDYPWSMQLSVEMAPRGGEWKDVAGGFGYRELPDGTKRPQS